MVVVFVLGLCVSALMERRAEVASIFNNRKNVIKGIEARNELFKDDFPREYQTWTETAKTDLESEFNGNIAVDALEKRPEMVILWAGYAFSKDYSTPRGHMHAIEDKIYRDEQGLSLMPHTAQPVLPAQNQALPPEVRAFLNAGRTR